MEQNIFRTAVEILEREKIEYNGDMWVGRAIDFTVALDEAFKGEVVEIKTTEDLYKFKEQMELNNLIDLGFNNPNEPHTEKLRTYLTSIFEFNANDLKNQSEKTISQHGYIEMQLSRILGDIIRNGVADTEEA